MRPHRAVGAGQPRLGADLRRLAGAHACSTVGYWAVTVAVLVWAHERGGRDRKSVV